MQWRKDGGRSGGLSATGAGVAMSLVAGLGLFALVTDTVTSVGNTSESGTYTPTTGQLAEIALVTAGGDCGTASYAPDTVASAITSTIDLNDTGVWEQGSNDICIRNVSGAPASLTAQYVNVLETEVGACEASESAVEGTGSCNDGDPGELSSVLQQDVFEVTQASANCQTAGGTFAAIMAAPLSLGAIGTGETCQYNLGHFFPGASEDDTYAAQTDRVEFDVAFVLTDDPPPPPDDNEPNDISGEATPITSTASGAIHPETDQDWFTYSHTGGTLSASTTTPDCADVSISDTVLTLYQSDGTEIATNDDVEASNFCSALSSPLPAGTYLLLVESFNNAGTVPEYTVNVSST